MDTKNSRSRGYIFLLIVAFLWGTQGTVTIILCQNGMTAVQVSSVRAIGTAVVLGAYFCLNRKQFVPVRPKDIPVFLVMGCAGMFMMNVMYSSAAQRVGASLTAALVYLSPLIVLPVSAVVFHERISFVKVASLILVLTGCAIACGIFYAEGPVSVSGILYGAGAACFYALYSLLLKHEINFYPSVQVSFLGAVGSLPCTMIGISWKAFVKLPFSPVFTLLIVVLAVFHGAVAFLLYAKGIELVGSGTASIVTVSELPFSAIISYLILHEDMPLYKLVGLSILVIAVLLLAADKGSSRTNELSVKKGALR